jgi:hypothetical protein
VLDLHIVCMRPGGMNRGGRRHDRHAVHSLADFTPAQLREMLAEPDLVLLGGVVLTEDYIGELEAEAQTKAGAKAAKAKG